MLNLTTLATLVIIVLIIIFLVNGKRFEGFDSISAEEFPLSKIQFIVPQEQEQEHDSESYPRPVKREYPRDPWRPEYLKGQMLETRHPGLIKHRYSYDDQRLCYKKPPPVLKDMARLQELPLQLRNWYHATLPKYLMKYDDFYQPSHILGRKYKNECRFANSACNLNRTVEPVIAPRMDASPNDPKANESPPDAARLKQFTSPYQKALLNKYFRTYKPEDYYDDIDYGWLPYEY